jgi:hypothetical protein
MEAWWGCWYRRWGWREALEALGTGPTRVYLQRNQRVSCVLEKSTQDINS